MTASLRNRIAKLEVHRRFNQSRYVMRSLPGESASSAIRRAGGIGQIGACVAVLPEPVHDAGTWLSMYGPR